MANRNRFIKIEHGSFYPGMLLATASYHDEMNLLPDFYAIIGVNTQHQYDSRMNREYDVLVLDALSAEEKLVQFRLVVGNITDLRVIT